MFLIYRILNPWKKYLNIFRFPCSYVEIKCQRDATDDFYCRSYCLLNIFRASLCPSSGPRECYTSGCCLSYLVLGFQEPANRTHNPQLHTIPTTWKPSTKYDRQQPLYNTLELLMMGIMVPETCWASNKICNKNHLLNLVGILFPQSFFFSSETISSSRRIPTHAFRLICVINGQQESSVSSAVQDSLRVPPTAIRYNT